MAQQAFTIGELVQAVADGNVREMRKAECQGGDAD